MLAGGEPQLEVDDEIVDIEGASEGEQMRDMVAWQSAINLRAKRRRQGLTD